MHLSKKINDFFANEELFLLMTFVSRVVYNFQSITASSKFLKLFLFSCFQEQGILTSNLKWSSVLPNSIWHSRHFDSSRVRNLSFFFCFPCQIQILEIDALFLKSRNILKDGYRNGCEKRLGAWVSLTLNAWNAKCLRFWISFFWILEYLHI